MSIKDGAGRDASGEKMMGSTPHEMRFTKVKQSKKPKSKT